MDTESSFGAPADGETYCGPRTFTFERLTSTEHASPASIVTFDGAETFSVLSTDATQYGHYSIDFGVTLDYYPGFTKQVLILPFEVIPDCLDAVIDYLADI